MYTLSSKYLRSELAAASIMLTYILLFNNHVINVDPYNYNNLLEIMKKIHDFHIVLNKNSI
jgi:hypothetical protein